MQINISFWFAQREYLLIDFSLSSNMRRYLSSTVLLILSIWEDESEGSSEFGYSVCFVSSCLSRNVVKTSVCVVIFGFSFLLFSWSFLSNVHWRKNVSTKSLWTHTDSRIHILIWNKQMVHSPWTVIVKKKHCFLVFTDHTHIYIYIYTFIPYTHIAFFLFLIGHSSVFFKFIYSIILFYKYILRWNMNILSLK